MELIICYLIVSHVLVFLVGRATSENQTLDKHYPGYREYVESKASGKGNGKPGDAGTWIESV